MSELPSLFVQLNEACQGHRKVTFEISPKSGRECVVMWEEGQILLALESNFAARLQAAMWLREYLT